MPMLFYRLRNINGPEYLRTQEWQSQEQKPSSTRVYSGRTCGRNIDKPRESYHLDSQVTPSQNLPVLKEIERQMILKRLSANKGNQRRTAQDLGIPKVHFS